MVTPNAIAAGSATSIDAKPPQTSPLQVCAGLTVLVSDCIEGFHFRYPIQQDKTSKRRC